MVSWVKSVPKTLFVLDGLMMMLFLIVMLPHTTGIPLHEWISFVFLVPFVLHLLFHWDWLVRMPPRFFAALRGEARFNVVWDLLLYLLMTFAIISGILASESALVAMGLDFDPDPFWTDVHHQYSNFLFPLVGVHLAMHWRWIINVAKQMFARTKATTVEEAA